MSLVKKSLLSIVLMVVTFICLTAFIFFVSSSCGAAYIKSLELERKTEETGIFRVYRVYNSFTGELITEFSGISYISNDSTPDDTTIYINDSEKGTWKKIDIFGKGFFIIAESNDIE